MKLIGPRERTEGLEVHVENIRAGIAVWQGAMASGERCNLSAGIRNFHRFPPVRLPRSLIIYPGSR